MKKTIVVYSGSKEISFQNMERLSDEFSKFILNNKNKIDCILFGGGDYGIMGLVHTIANTTSTGIKGYSTEEYRKYDENNSVENITFFENDKERIKSFIKNGDIFLVLPGGDGTAKETITTKKLLKDKAKVGNSIIISELSPLADYYKKLWTSGLEENNGIITISKDLSEIIL